MSDLKVPPPPPSREEAAARWQALAAGEVIREAVHSWAASWVEDEVERGFAPLVFGALQYLHGFDLCQDPNRPGVVWHGISDEGKWIHSLDDIASGLARWQARCEPHDADPLAWPQTEDERLRALIQAREAEDGQG
ncbi:hypothetical protein [Streptomyces sp. NBC_00328]|uniref:hypothetical protein n=1 Tax=Streptomyces sp. NBC_00328 TaxID=2903646 RepID=UPI002E2C6D0D|nr:hypothetical protein [Streptomyces sp. NBC_00328]